MNKRKKMMKDMNVGIIGAGRIAHVHATNLTSYIAHVRVKTIADPYLTDNAKKWITECGIENITKDYKEILGDSDIDAVFICSSTDTHARFTREAAEAGKHIFCEKPIDLNPEEIIKTINAVKKEGVKLQVGFNRRFDHNYLALKEAVLKKKIGDLHLVRITSRDPAPPSIEYIKKSGGLFMDMTVHDFDMVRFLTDSEVDEIFAYGDVKVDPAIGRAGDIDTAIISMRMKNGVLAFIENSRETKYGYDQRGEVFGSRGAMESGNDTLHSAVLSDSKGVHAEKPLYFFLERYNNAYVAEVSNFLQAVRKDKPVSVSGIDGLHSILVAEAALKSLHSGKSEKVIYR